MMDQNDITRKNKEQKQYRPGTFKLLAVKTDFTTKQKRILL